MELGAGLGTKMVEWNRVMPITKMVDGDRVEWHPILDELMKRWETGEQMACGRQWKRRGQNEDGSY